MEQEQVWTDVEYDYDSPEVFYLDSKLTEISGLAYREDKDLLIAHNDEKGDVYELSPSDGSVYSVINFNGVGDYESVEYYNSDYVIGESNGDLHFYNIERKDLSFKDSKLSSKNDVEGMCVDRNGKRLLLACKGQPKGISKSKKVKVVYTFDLSVDSLVKEPFLVIHDHMIEKVVKQSNASVSKSKLKKLSKRALDFSPSGIAIQPSSKEYYLISARGSTLLIIDTDKRLKDVVFLDDKSNKQPEGITFDKHDNLYISTEGRSMRAKMFKFKAINTGK